MAYLLRVPVALLGLLIVRGFLYPKGWGRRSLAAGLWAGLGIALTLPLASYSTPGLITAVAAGLVILFPYRRAAAAYMKARTRAGLRRLAADWDVRLSEDPKTGRWDVVRDGAGTRAWVGNVLTREGSVDPAVKRKEVGFMLAFVIELALEPPFQCSIMMGWERPRYFEREWRATHVIHGEFLALPFGDVGLASDRGRATGGRASRLEPYPGLLPEHDRPVTAIGTNPEGFARVFDRGLLERLFKVAARTFPYELNVTPSSVNIYTTYCDAEVQRANLALLETIVARLEEKR